VLFIGCGKPEPQTAEESASPAAEPTEQFYEAALEGIVDVVKGEVDRGVDVNVRSKEGHTALMLAAFNGQADVAALLLDAGADVSLKDGSGRTALMFASTGPSRATVELLLKHKAKVNEVDGGERWTPLMFAAAEGHTDVVAALLAAGADPGMQDTDGDSARDFALQRGHKALAERL
jgi:ankyrin repeat protein